MSDKPRTTVVNIHHRVPFDVYIGRAGRGHDGTFGNPHPVNKPCNLCSGAVHKRGEALEAYRAYFNNRINTDQEFKQRILALRGRILGCFCVPNGCHGHVIAEWLDSQSTY